MRNPLLDQKYSDYDELEGVTRLIAPFIACGDLNVAPDADKTYPLELDGREYTSHAPIASPISPPYERAKLMKQSNLLGKQIVDADATNTSVTATATSIPPTFSSQQSNENTNQPRNSLNDENNSKLSDLTISN